MATAHTSGCVAAWRHQSRQHHHHNHQMPSSSHLSSSSSSSRSWISSVRDVTTTTSKKDGHHRHDDMPASRSCKKGVRSVRHLISSSFSFSSLSSPSLLSPSPPPPPPPPPPKLVTMNHLVKSSCPLLASFVFLVCILLTLPHHSRAQAFGPRLPPTAADHNKDSSLNEYSILDEIARLRLNRTLNIYSPYSSQSSSSSSSSSSSNTDYDYAQFMQYSIDDGGGLAGADASANGHSYSLNYAGENGMSATETIFYPSDGNYKAPRNVKSGEQCTGDICTDGIFKWHRSKVKNIYVGGIFPMMGGWAGGQSCLPSAIMALNEVNLNASILPKYRIILNWFNSECNPGKGISNLYEMIFHKEKNQDDIIMLLGPGCSDVSSSVAEVANYWNLTVLSFGSSSPALSNRARFKTFFRTHPSAILDNPARLKLCELFKWRKIATIQDNKEVFTSTVDNLEKEAKDFNITIIARQTFTNDPTYAVKNLKKQDARIIVGVFYEQEARKVFCQAYKEGMIFPKYIWMIIGWYSANWYLEVDDEISCNRTEMEIAVYGHLTTEVQFFSNKIHEKLENGISVVEYDQNFRKFVSSAKWKSFSKRFPKIDYKFRTGSGVNGGSYIGSGVSSSSSPSSVFVSQDDTKTLLDLYEKIENENSKDIEKLGGHLERALAYDAVWVMAYSLNYTLKKFGSLEKFNISNYIISNYIKEAMKKTNFKGVSGLVMFNEQGDRISEVLYEQLQNQSGVLGYVKLGTHFKTKFDCCMNITWGKSKHAPLDGVKTITKSTSINPFYSKCFFMLSLISIVIGAVCFAFNYRFRARKIIKYSKPEINNMVILGCCLCLCSVFIFGYDKSDVKTRAFNSLCKIGTWMLMLGFTIGYGSLFSKIWFVYTASIEKKKNSKYAALPPKKIKFYAVIIVMVVLDLIILIVWLFQDPLEETIQKLQVEKTSNEDELIEPVIRICKCNHEYIWIGVCFSLKGIVLIMGLFLSYETRNSKIEWVNDSKFIALSIYNIVVLTLITAPVTIIIQNQHQLDASFSFIAFAINMCSLLTFALIFIPKIKHILRHRAEEDLFDPYVDKQTLEQKKEKYYKLKKENEELSEVISKREELLLKLERILNPNFAIKKAESVRFEFTRKSFQGDKKSCGEDSSSNNTPLNVYNFEIQSEYSTTKIQTNETEF